MDALAPTLAATMQVDESLVEPIGSALRGAMDAQPISPTDLAPTLVQAAMEENPLDRVRHSRSFNDVKAVDAGHALHPPPLKKIRRSAMSEALFTNGRLKAVQEDENEVAEVVIVCEPEGATLMMGGLHPR
jgi:hypothetical protein